MATRVLGEFSWERMIGAVEKVRERAVRAARALEDAAAPYAMIGGNAVAAHVARHEKGGVRNTPNVDVLVNRSDWKLVATALESVGFVFCQTTRGPIFLDGAAGNPRSAVHLYFADERLRPDDLEPNPSLQNRERMPDFQTLPLQVIVQMKLVANRTIDRVHICDLIDVGLVDESWPQRFRPELADRLQHLLDTPDA